MDYEEVDTLLTFNPTVSTILVPVTIINDLVDEPEEEFEAELELITVTIMRAAPDMATVLIDDDDREWFHIFCIIEQRKCDIYLTPGSLWIDMSLSETAIGWY